ncbi:MAG: hypothetical protein HYV27_09890 [Candidatus Hydrogenedentes bacterium]|nr:hypothetical protein [Candidatus Hydrogenedentota bacterium]
MAKKDSICRTLVLAACVVGITGAAWAQDLLGSVLSGDLVDPKPGTYAWYELSGKEADGKMYLRIALVGSEKVKRKTGYWIETELVPAVGFSSVYKMLLTGPANKTENVHRLIVKEGERPAEEVPIDVTGDEAEAAPEERESLGPEEVRYAGGTIPATKVRVSSGDQSIELWLNETVKPMGIVRMVSPQGELVLQRFGEGGKDGTSAIVLPGEGVKPEPERKFKVEVEDGATKNFSGRKSGAKDR